MLTIIGILIILSIVTLLMMGKVSPIIAMSCIPFIGALIAGYSIAEISTFFESGINKVSKVAAMFLFAILFFSLMKDLHIFDPLIRLMVKMTRGNVIIVCVMTTLIAGLVHLDGSGAATFLIIIPALLPLYRQLGMSPYLMLLLMCASMGIMNMVPWGGPLGRASAVTGIDAATLWQSLIPVQIIGMAGAAVFAALMGVREKRRIAAAAAKGTTPYMMDSLLPANEQMADISEQTHKPKKPWINGGLILASVICLAFGLLSAPYVFMIALSIALLVNFPNPKDQMKVLSQHAPQALGMVAIILAAGAFLGILSEGGMLKSIAEDLTAILPTEWVSKIHIFVGILGVPMDIFTSTDAYYFALLPIIQQIAETAGVDPSSVVYAMAIGNNAGTFVSPFSPAAWLAMGLAGIDMGRHLRYSFGWIWLFSFFTLAIGAVLGLY
ncbi:CitMHS family transporter [Providencia vermicola]|uniref:TRAP transporter large permease subunit n=2 Tax=Providencia TaxID=586 RepID=A0AAI9I2Y2_PROST|nr:MULTISPECIES: citrate:proton symporter [Providencia]ELR5044621.1 TRAP transporter large permease subunit [Providencia rettgeri]MTB42107.1 TRAP transporter large permease subunit [Providencia sp. wls1949]MTC07944.1 TRAP transporter large permease subunit [Providencia sp. wls1948]ELR5037319.1 TRAP transporter large permease subunit [Providencia stuartii]ELR5120357.1 TRAP transporter large permease subunit [Providencia stuartii]